MGEQGLTTLSISIVTVTLNSGSRVRGAIESALAQANDRLQYIVIDGGSGLPNVQAETLIKTIMSSL